MIHPAVLREEDDSGRLGDVAIRRKRANSEIERIMDEYVAAADLPPIQETEEVEVNPDVCRAIAKEFDSLPFSDENELVSDAYAALVSEITWQFDLLSRYYLLEAYGDEDRVPYNNSMEMMDDVRKYHHLYVYTGGENHALLSREENWKFRAVHDLVGHAMKGYGFGPRGEENAWIEHSKTVTPFARAALTTETRAQNSFVNCFGRHADLPIKERPYAEQKAALLSERFWTHEEFERAYQDYPDFLQIG